MLALLTLTLGWTNASAQTDVTSQYITNPSFESDGLMSAGNGTNPIMIQPTGWTQEQNAAGSYQDNKICNAETSNGSNYGTLVTPSDGTYYLFYRHGWNGSNYAKFTSMATNLPAGAYTLKVDYKMVSGSDNTDNNNNTAITLSAICGETTLGTTTAKGAVQVNSNGTTAVLKDNDWITLETTFTLDTETSTQFVINLLACGPKRSDFVVDNVRLLQTAFIDPTTVNLSASTLEMIVTGKKTLTATFTPADANHNTDITWTSSNESVATVADGVVTAVAAGTATISATTANNVTATCTVTVNEAPLADGDFYLYNEGAGKYVVGANNWGTRASIETSGIKMTATLSDGKYTLSTAPTYTGNYLGVDGYVDQGSAQWYLIPTSGDGYIMQCSSNSKYLVWDGASTTTTSMTDVEPTDSKGYWTFKSAADRLAVLETATKASPKEATYLIGNPDFSRNANLGLWTYTSSYSSEFKVGGGDNINNNLQQWNGYCTVYQDVNNLPNGLYKMTVQGFYRPGNSTTTSTAQNVTIYAGDEEELLMLHTNGAPASEDAANGFTADTGQGSWVPNSQEGASKAFTAGYYVNEVDNILTTDGTIRIGATNTTTLANQWMVLDNFRLYYYGPTISSTATALPEGSLTAGTWYYFDVAVDGDYDLTVTSLSDVVYTTDAKVLVEDAGNVTTNFAKTNELALTAGRYYVKSSSAQTFAITPASYDYSLGEPVLSTADGGYTQNSTFTATFPNAATNDPNDEVALVDGSKATVNGIEVALTAVTDGFSLDLGTLTEGAEFAISIPAGVYGYVTGETYNEAIELTIHIPYVFDGTYFVRNSDGKYISRGGDYNTRAIVDEFGLPLSVATDASGITQFTYIDNNGKLFLNGSGNAYTDNVSDPDWILEATEGGYYLVHATGNFKDKKLNIYEGTALYATTTDGAVFAFEPVSEHNTYMEALKDAQAATAATALGNTTITTKAGLAEWLAANYSAVPVTVDAVSFTEKWNGDASAEWGAGKDMYTAIVTNLPEGLYKLTVNAYYRLNASATAAEGARANVYLYGNDVKTQLYSIHEFPATEPWVSGNDQQDSYGYYPNNPTGGEAALTAGNYLTELYVYHTGGDFTYGIHQPSRFSNQQWFGFQNFTLTRYEAPASITIKAGRQYTAFSYDKPLDFEGSALTAQIVTSATGKTENVTKVPANTGIIVGLAEATTEATTISVPVCTGTTDDVTENMLVAVVEATTIQQNADGFTNYVFGKSGGKEQFFKVRAAGMVVPANNAYLAVPEGEAKGLDVIGFGEDATSINAFENENLLNGDIYNLQGQKVNRAHKGVYIVNGKKIVKK